jgi:hypothetical protein
VLAEVVHKAARGEKVDRAQVLSSGGVVVVACRKKRMSSAGFAKKARGHPEI